MDFLLLSATRIRITTTMMKSSLTKWLQEKPFTVAATSDTVLLLEDPLNQLDTYLGTFYKIKRKAKGGVKYSPHILGGFQSGAHIHTWKFSESQKEKKIERYRRKMGENIPFSA